MLLQQSHFQAARTVRAAVRTLAAIAFAAAALAAAAAPAKPPTAVRAAFGADCETVLIEELGRARRSLHVAIYSITRRNITRALVAAAARGVDVRLKYDADSYKWRGMKAAIGYLRKRGIRCEEIRMTGEYAKMHHKFTVIDGVRVVTGSFNYTTSGSSVNYENLVVIADRDIAEQFIAEFEVITGR